MKLLKRFGFTALACVALIMGGCASHHYYTAEYSSDRTINNQVRHNLSHGSTYGFPNVNVQTYNGIVELDGYVETPQQQTEAEQFAATVPGVRQVNDNLRVSTAPPPVAPTGRIPIIRRNP
jgi:osmotically-inducible protein OsmY